MESALFHRDFGGEGNPPLILLHGLLGSSRNWVTVGKLLAARFHVCALDLRNHGSSPHDETMDYPSMAQDVMEWMETQHVRATHIVGHSMGGKTAMWLACNFPERISSLTIADIAPKPYNPHFRIAFEAMHHVNPAQFTRISEVEQALAEKISDPTLRQFLVTNLIRNPQGTFDWQIHLQALTRALPALSANPIAPDMHYEGPSQLLYGETSDFVTPGDWPQIQHHFPRCRIVKVPGAGHNVHVENRNDFADNVISMLDR